MALIDSMPVGLCNYCAIEWIQRKAEQAGMKITVETSLEGYGGFDVMIHYPLKDPNPWFRTRTAVTNGKGSIVMWVMEISDRCKHEGGCNGRNRRNDG